MTLNEIDVCSHPGSASLSKSFTFSQPECLGLEIGDNTAALTPKVALKIK